MKSRTRARGIALQVLYEYDLAGHPLSEAVAARLEDEKLEPNLKILSARSCMRGYPNHRKMDTVITEHAPEWPLDQVAVIDRNILRISFGSSVSPNVRQ